MLPGSRLNSAICVTLLVHKKRKNASVCFDVPLGLPDAALLQPRPTAPSAAPTLPCNVSYTHKQLLVLTWKIRAFESSAAIVDRWRRELLILDRCGSDSESDDGEAVPA